MTSEIALAKDMIARVATVAVWMRTPTVFDEDQVTTVQGGKILTLKFLGGRPAAFVDGREVDWPKDAESFFGLAQPLIIG